MDRVDWAESERRSGRYESYDVGVAGCHCDGSSGRRSLAVVTADNGDARGWRAGENSGSSGGTVAGSWSKLLGLGDGLQQSYAYTSYGQLSATPTPTWQNVAGTEALAVNEQIKLTQ